MKKVTNLIIGAVALLGVCVTAEAGGDKTVTESLAVTGVMNETDTKWPPANCLTAAQIKKFVKDNPSRMTWLGIYSDGSAFWLGFDHGKHVLNPNAPVIVPRGKPYLIRWNISDTPSGGHPISSNYGFDYDGGPYAVNAFAINKCALKTGEIDQYDCDQPLFGEKEWRKDSGFCPAIILDDDPSSIYLYDLNYDAQVYEYSVALVLKAKNPDDQKAGIRIIIDPKIKNGGQD